MPDNKTILITGATAGIGRHAALHLARAGHRVFATGRRRTALDALEREADGLSLETLVLDVTDETSIEAARRAVDEATDGRGVDALVNNAGFGLMGPLELLGDAELRRQYDTNVFGLLAVTRAFVPAMRERGDGRVVNISSVGGRMTFPLMGAYNSTKYAVESLSDALRAELAPFGVKVVLVEPGPIKTNFADTALDSIGAIGVEGTVYAPIVEHANAVKDKFARFEAEPIVISRAIEKAVVRRSPRARYVAPFSSLLMLGLFKMMPTWLADAILRSQTRLTRRGLLLQERTATAA